MNRTPASTGSRSSLVRAAVHTPSLVIRWRLAALFCLITAFAIPGATSAWGVTRRDDQPDQSYLDLAASPDYASVGTFSSGLTGCGTLIAPDWVLTAAHLFLQSSGTFTINGATYSANQLIKHPQYVSGREMQGYDIGLAHLTTPVPSVTPATLYSSSLEPVYVMTFVAFGMTGTGLTGANTTDLKRRACQNLPDGDYGSPAVLLGSDFDNPHSPADSDFGDPAPLPLEGLPAYGDSGGGVFLTADAKTYLAGVISFVASTDGLGNSNYGDVTGFGRVSAFRDWINLRIPEPSTAGLTGLGAAFLLLYRRRK
ncbi:MAG TPA: trypsin-like serine protease [Candidatus Paceibacterota bacterium]|nr:trypsin-like serine protease [Verrucomicrobiota bacterium]HSA12289.1 trypsin-like serine protease [Candidatus Paceibacterota bacterium]